LGNPAHLQGWKNIADKESAYFLEDNCESLGAVSRDKPGPFRKLCGTFGMLSTSSFYFSHQISAIEGGMILTDDDEAADLCRMLRAHGWTRDLDGAGAGGGEFDREYDFRLHGYNVRPLELHAAIAREQLKKLDQFRRQRHQNYNNMVCWCADLPVKFPIANGILSPFAINFTLKDHETRAKLVKALRMNGIDCRLPTGGSFRKHPYARQWADQETPNADKLHDTGLFIGNPPWPAEEDLLKAVKVMEGVLR
jgi:CDP-6-deoxy-D-xylo-4-hexulose-3-dehydrase